MEAERPRRIISAGWLLLLPVLYVLSAGPITMLERNGMLPVNKSINSALKTFYLPLWWLNNDAPAVLKTPFREYLRLWEGA